MQAAPGQGIVLGSNGDSSYTSLQLDYSQPSLSTLPPVLTLNVSHPRLIVLNRFIEDALYAAKTLQVDYTLRSIDESLSMSICMSATELAISRLSQYVIYHAEVEQLKITI